MAWSWAAITAKETSIIPESTLDNSYDDFLPAKWQVLASRTRSGGGRSPTGNARGKLQRRPPSLSRSGAPPGFPIALRSGRPSPLVNATEAPDTGLPFAAVTVAVAVLCDVPLAVIDGGESETAM
jgi:hypothetical protein